jgi:hypothetical protein
MPPSAIHGDAKGHYYDYHHSSAAAAAAWPNL